MGEGRVVEDRWCEAGERNKSGIGRDRDHFGGHFCDERFVAVADDRVDFGEGAEFLGSALGVAAGDDDADPGIFAANAAQVGAGLAVGFGGDTTGIYNHDVGVGGLGSRVKSAHAQAGGNGLTVGTAGAAAEVFDVIFCHVAQCINRGKSRTVIADAKPIPASNRRLVYDPRTSQEPYETAHSSGRR